MYTLRALSKRLPGTRSLHATRIAFNAPGLSAIEENVPSHIYVKQDIGTADPQGTTYVVSEPEASAGNHDVPPGAYPSSSPYVNFAGGVRGRTMDALQSSTSSTPAHPETTKRVPTNESGVGESAAVRHTEAPGEMGKRGGGDGGLNLMDASGTRMGEKGELKDVNEAPIHNVERKARLGNENAWKERR
jgi:hypothetical protein